MQVTGIIKARARTNKAFKLDDNNWYEVSGKAEDFITAMEKPYPNVEVTYEQAGYKRKASFIKPLGAATGAPATVQTGSESKPTYTPKSSYKPKATQEEYKPDQAYWAKKTLEIKKGNALNAAASSLSGTELDVEVLAEKVIFLANKYYEYLTLED